MAQVANTYETYDAKGIREELSDRIWMIDREETPFLSLIGRKAVKTEHPEWQTDELPNINLDNNHPEGEDWSFDAISPTTRIGNYTQISNQRFVISRNLDKTDKAGRKSELAYQTKKYGVALRRDMEGICLSNQASSAGSGNGATNRKLGGFRAWLATNDDLGATGSSGGYNSSTNVVDAATNGTQRAFTKAMIDSIMLSTHTAGGKPSVLMVSPYVKTVFSRFMDDADIVPLRTDVKTKGDVTLIASADAYLSDFGLLSVVSNVQMAEAGAAVARNAFFIDPKMVTLGVYDDIMLEKPAKTGDAEKRVLQAEYTLIVNNEKAHGVAADLYGLTAST